MKISQPPVRSNATEVAEFLRWIEAGHGFVGMHSATDTYRGHKPLSPYTQMINGEFLTHGAQAASG